MAYPFDYIAYDNTISGKLVIAIAKPQEKGQSLLGDSRGQSLFCSASGVFLGETPWTLTILALSVSLTREWYHRTRGVAMRMAAGTSGFVMPLDCGGASHWPSSLLRLSELVAVGPDFFEGGDVLVN